MNACVKHVFCLSINLGALKLGALLREYSETGKVDNGRRVQNFDFCAFFSGHTRASGWFSDRFGNPRRHFCGDFYGMYKDDIFLLDEKLYHSNGIQEVRSWKVSINDRGVFKAQSDSLIGDAQGLISGNRLSMQYSMKVKIEKDKYWDLDMKDVMISQPDGSLHNIAQVFKWGVRLGTISTQYQHHNGEKMCIDCLR